MTEGREGERKEGWEESGREGRRKKKKKENMIQGEEAKVPGL